MRRIEISELRFSAEEEGPGSPAQRRLQEKLDQIAAAKLDAVVSFDTERYSSEANLKYRASACAIMRRIAKTVLSEPRPGPESQPPETQEAKNVLYHWDISENNVLVDRSTGRATALLDWEQLHTVPLTVPDFYPPIMEAKNTFGELSNLSEWTPDRGEKNCDREEREDRRDRQHIRVGFCSRLRELNSPWLATWPNAPTPTMGWDEIDDFRPPLEAAVLRTLMEERYSKANMDQLEHQVEDAGLCNTALPTGPETLKTRSDWRARLEQ